ncbi:MAG: lactonase family protein [Acidobacteriota bacterium]|nr:lactonase family protein [Acidobacteriota bacterium]
MTACGGGTIGFMWVLGTQYNQIVGFKIDQYTGNLTQTVNSPYASGGKNPVSIAVRAGGRYVYVVNKGTGNGDGNVAVFAVGNDGILTFQESYSTAGNTPVWAATDGTGNYLYVLDSQAPDYATSKNGDVTVFSIDGNTGRLQLVPNQAIKSAQGQQLNYFSVGKNPTMLRYSGTCLYTLDSGDQTIFPYGVGSGGQLTLEANSTIPTGTTNMTSINVSGSNMYVTDAGNGTVPGSVIPYTTGTNCSLSVQADGPVQNLAGTASPVYSVTDSKNKYLYVLNQKNTNTNTSTANSSISAFTIDASTGRLQALSDVQNPYSVGNGPVCMMEDPSNQYFYVTSGLDGTITGKLLNQNTGQLSGLSRGSVFTGTGLETCLAISGNVD